MRFTAASERAGDFGNVVEITHRGGITTRYAHASRLLVEVGDRVRAGEVIARAGATGRATGPHVHLEVLVEGRAVDPTPYLAGRLALEGR